MTERTLWLLASLLGQKVTATNLVLNAIAFNDIIGQLLVRIVIADLSSLLRVLVVVCEEESATRVGQVSARVCVVWWWNLGVCRGVQAVKGGQRDDREHGSDGFSHGWHPALIVS